MFLDPILHKQWKFAIKNRLKIIEKYDRIDLFKADIYSLGLTFFKAVTCLNVSGYNSSKS